MYFKKKAILLIHGFIGGIYDYNNFQNELQIHKCFDVFTFTLPGHEKVIVKDVKYEDWINEAERQIKFLIENNYKEIYIMGHSMGGVIAAHLASKYKEVKKLVLLAPAFRYLDFKDGKINIKSFNESIKDTPEIMKNMGKGSVIERFQKTPITTMIEFVKLVDVYEKDLEKITCPILTIRGKNDKIVPIESTNLVYNTVQSKTNILINIDKITHDCFKKERTDELKEIIIDFIKKKPSGKKETLDI